MKNVQGVIAVAAAFMASALSSEAVLDVRLSIQNSTDVVLRWPSRATDVFIIAYRPTLDPSTSWTFLDTAYAASSAGAETTYIHPNVVVFPPPEAGEGGGGESPPSPSSSQSTASYSTMTEEEREAYREERYREAQATAKYLMALLEEAVAKADADRERRQKEGTLTSTSQTSATTGESAAVQRPLGSMGFYLVTEVAEDADGDGLPNDIELAIGLNLLKTDSDGDSIRDGDEDLDGDSRSNLHEIVAATDPLVADELITHTFLTSGAAIREEFEVELPGTSPFGAATTIDTQLAVYGNDGDGIGGIYTRVPTPQGTVQVTFYSVFIEGAFAAAAQPAGEFDLTPEELRQLGDAYGPGTLTKRPIQHAECSEPTAGSGINFGES